PNDKGAASALRAAYAARGDVAAAITMIEREVAITDGPLQKARLYAEMAKIARDKLKDDTAAAKNAHLSLDHDATNIIAMMILGDIAFENNKFREAAQRFEAVVQRSDGL